MNDKAQLTQEILLLEDQLAEATNQHKLRVALCGLAPFLTIGMGGFMMVRSYNPNWGIGITNSSQFYTGLFLAIFGLALTLFVVTVTTIKESAMKKQKRLLIEKKTSLASL